MAESRTSNVGMPTQDEIARVRAWECSQTNHDWVDISVDGTPTAFGCRHCRARIKAVLDDTPLNVCGACWHEWTLHDEGCNVDRCGCRRGAPIGDVDG